MLSAFKICILSSYCLLLNVDSVPQEPCTQAMPFVKKLSVFASSEVFIYAKEALKLSAHDNREHGIVFGKDSVGNIIASTLTAGGFVNSTSMDLQFPGAFADLHNHPGNSTPSAGDIYNLIEVNQRRPAFDSRITLLKNGTLYAIVIVDPAMAAIFQKAYPPEQTEGFSPRFPPVLFNEFAELKSYLINITGLDRMLADEIATVIILDKYRTGISLLRLNDNSQFERIVVEIHNTSEGNGIYNRRVCKYQEDAQR